jgi:RimJ/RimL family protein N-acetyltransferase
MNAAIETNSLHPAARKGTKGLSFQSQPDIRTARLRLRKLKPEDQYRIADAMQTPDIVRMLTAVPLPYDHHDALDWIRCWENEEIDGWAYAITFDGGALEGVITIDWRESKTHSGWTLGYWLRPDHWGAGYMSEAASAVVERFFSRMMGEIVYSGALCENPASLKVQEKLGFQVTGTSQTFSRSRMELVNMIETEVTFGSFMPV